MTRVMRNARIAVALSIFTGASVWWAVPVVGAALGSPRVSVITATTIPALIKFRVVRDRGLLVTGWLNGSGPYTFVIDTGAGVSIISQSAILRAAIPVQPAQRTLLGGLG